MTSSGWRGFLNLDSWLLVIFAGSYFVGDQATAAGWFDVGAMLSAAAVPVGVVMGFGITYAADAWGRRVARHGLDREAETAALVGVYFFASLVALGATLAHSGWPQGRTWCLPWVCGGGASAGGFCRSLRPATHHREGGGYRCSVGSAGGCSSRCCVGPPPKASD